MPSSRIEFSELAGLAAGKARRGMQLNPLDLPRLAEFVVIRGGDEFEDSNQTSEWLGTDVRFEDGPEGFPRVHLTITGNLVLECQRCLQPVGWQVELESQLTVLSDEAQTAELEDPFDSVLMDIEGLSLQVLVEDEILAAFGDLTFGERRLVAS